MTTESVAQSETHDEVYERFVKAFCELNTENRNSIASVILNMLEGKTIRQSFLDTGMSKIEFEEMDEWVKASKKEP